MFMTTLFLREKEEDDDPRDAMQRPLDTPPNTDVPTPEPAPEPEIAPEPAPEPVIRPTPPDKRPTALGKPVKVRRPKMAGAEVGEYRGRAVILNKPFPTMNGPKQFAVYVHNDEGRVVRVDFSAPGGSHTKDAKSRKKLQGHQKCDDPGPRWTAQYWACKVISPTTFAKWAEKEPDMKPRGDRPDIPTALTPQGFRKPPKTPKQRRRQKHIKKTKKHDRIESFGYMADIT